MQLFVNKQMTPAINELYVVFTREFQKESGTFRIMVIVFLRLFFHWNVSF